MTTVSRRNIYLKPQEWNSLLNIANNTKVFEWKRTVGINLRVNKANGAQVILCQIVNKNLLTNCRNQTAIHWIDTSNGSFFGVFTSLINKKPKLICYAYVQKVGGIMLIVGWRWWFIFCIKVDNASLVWIWMWNTVAKSRAFGDENFSIKKKHETLTKATKVTVG